VAYTSIGKCKVEVEYFGEWTPLVVNEDGSISAAGPDKACTPVK